MQATQDHDNASSTAQDTSHHEPRADAASDADSEDDLLNQVGLRLCQVLSISKNMAQVGEGSSHTQDPVHALAALLHAGQLELRAIIADLQKGMQQQHGGRRGA